MSHRQEGAGCSAKSCFRGRFPSTPEWHTIIISVLEVYLSVVNALDEGAFQFNTWKTWVFGTLAVMESVGLLFAVAVMLLRAFEVGDGYLGESGGSPILMIWEAHSLGEQDNKQDLPGEPGEPNKHKSLLTIAVNAGLGLQTAAMFVCLTTLRYLDGTYGLGAALASGIVSTAFTVFAGWVGVKRLSQAAGETRQAENDHHPPKWWRHAVESLLLMLRCYFLLPLGIEIAEAVLIFLDASAIFSHANVLALLDLFLFVGALPGVAVFLFKPLFHHHRLMLRQSVFQA